MIYMSTINENYEKLRHLLSPPIGVPLQKGELTDKLLRNIYTEEEAFIVANGFKKSLRPVSLRSIRKRVKIPKKQLKEKLNDMDYKGKIIKISHFYIIPPYLPGLVEFYFTNDSDDPENL